jgi:DNA-binding NarL/FixJ family response regulator
MKKIRVLIVDDHTVFAESLALVINFQRDMEAVGTANTCVSALESVPKLAPDVVLLDVMLPDGDGIDVAEAVKHIQPAIKTVILTSATEDDVLLRAIDAGASGFITKTRAVDDVIAAVRAAHQGEILIPPTMLLGLLSRLHQRRRQEDAAHVTFEPLTPREREVLQALARGLDNRDAAVQLKISPNTLRTHLQNVMGKLHVHSKLEAVVIALKHGLIDVEK